MAGSMTSSVLSTATQQLIFACVPLAIVGLLGILSVRATDTSRAVRCELIGRVIAGLSICIYMLHFIPTAKKLFMDFGAELPLLSVWVIQISDGLIRNFFYLLPVLCTMASALGIEIVLFQDLHRQDATRTQARIWSGCTTALMLISLALPALGILLPLIEVLNNLS
jgi:hypothetical protein